MKKNKEIFNNIIGYDKTKKTLERIVDVLNNQEKYKKLGSTIPHGLFIYGPPGLGKTTFSKELLKHVKNRHTYIVRKVKSDGDFMNYLNSIFNQAKKNQPSIILLDDIDKYSEDNKHNNNEEFVAVQSLIDSIKNEDIFVIATANNKYVLPYSLLRSGRFDIKIEIDYPKESESLNIIKYYLRNKKLSKSVNLKHISYILGRSSCADLEKVCNQAGIYAGFKNKKEIGMNELLRAALEESYGTNIEYLNEKDKYSQETAYHEAAHALIGEILEPGSISFITIAKTDSNTKGLTKFHNNEYYYDDIKYMQNRIITLLAGKAATEIIYHKCDVGSGEDIERAFNIAERFIDNYCLNDFNSFLREHSSDKTKENKDLNTAKLITNYYQQAKELLIANRDKLDLLANTLSSKKILFQDEIRNIIS